MKRRGFLGLLGGAAVAGPGIAKQAVAGLGDLALHLAVVLAALVGGFVLYVAIPWLAANIHISWGG